MGWYMEYVGRLLRGYPQFTLDYIQLDLPLILGWALVNFYLENDGWLQFAGLKVSKDSKTYIEQEIDKLIKQYYDAKPVKEKV